MNNYPHTRFLQRAAVTRLAYNAAACLLVALQLLILSTITLAVTSGPSQPEFKSWTPTERDNLVDPFTGDFQYSIPLFGLPSPNGDFPFILTYRPGVGLEQEASWVGLGWSLNPGSISRQVKGIPDDFKGDGNSADDITAVYDMVPSWTVGVGGRTNLEVYGGDTSKGTPLSASAQIYYNNYKGWGYSGSLGYTAEMPIEEELLRGGAAFELTFDTQIGTSLHLQPSLSFKDIYKVNLDIDLDTVDGLNALSLNTDLQYKLDQPNGNEDSTGTKNLSIFNFGYSSYVSPGHIPDPGYDSTGKNFQLSLKTGGEVFGLFLNPSVKVFYKDQSIDGRGEIKHRKPFGYLHLHEADENSLLDFHREKEGPLWKAIKNLPNPILTNDLYNVSGTTLAGTFRAFRNDFPVLYDPVRRSDNFGLAGAFEIGPGAYLHGGVDIGYTDSSTVSSAWQHSNALHDKTKDHVRFLKHHKKEFVYFQFLGEPVNQESFFVPHAKDETRRGFGDDLPIRLVIDKDGNFQKKRPVATSLLESKPPVIADHTDSEYQIGDDLPDAWERTIADAVPNDGYENEYDISATDDFDNDGYTNLEEFKRKTNPLKTLDYGVFTEPSKEEIPRNPRIAAIQAFTNEEIINVSGSTAGSTEDASRIFGTTVVNLEFRRNYPNHIGAFVITDASGMRYIYGIPVYNRRHEEFHFSVKKGGSSTVADETAAVCKISVDGSEADGKVDINYDKSETDGYYHKKTISPYITTYLLTAVLGPDYQDVDGHAGPSVGDFGHWVRFSYTGPEIYKWRAPYIGANFVPGYDKKRDDKASFSYGEREVWYLESAETKTHVAFFDISVRKDAHGASAIIQNEGYNVSSESTKSRRLDKIRLYSKENCSHSDCDNTPLQVIHFEYNYELAKGVPNYREYENDADEAINGGKLTLKKIAITYHDSQQGLSSPHVFEYYTQNPCGEAFRYEEYSQDCWAHYAGKRRCDARNPYTDQGLSPSKHDEMASAWNIKKITEPGGGSITISYERDRYAFVQDRPALRMYQIASVNEEFSKRKDIVQPGIVHPDPRPSRVYIEIEKNMSAEDFANTYLKDIEQIYFKARLNLNEESAGGARYWAYVSGYAEFQACGTKDYGGKTYGCVQLAPVADQFHPFSIAGWEHLRLQEPDKISPDIINIDPKASPADKAYHMLTALPRVAEKLNVLGIIDGVYRTWLDEGRATIVGSGAAGTGQEGLLLAWIRLRSPSSGKFGGGSRVRQIIVDDGWLEETDTETPVQTPSCNSPGRSCYGYVYEYTEKDGSSSGVATYEPLIGGEENPIRTAKKFKERYWFKTDHNLFYENPVNEGYYPSPSVGYRRVRRYSLAAYSALNKLPIQEKWKCPSNHTGDEETTTGYDTAYIPSVRGPVDFEFYTAKEYPVRVDETRPLKEQHFFPLPIFFLGMVTAQTRGFSQGYSIVLNNMNGKPARTVEYAINEKGEILENSPVRSVEYIYRDNPMNVVRATRNVPTEKSKRYLGRKDELFIDMRQQTSETSNIGLNPNLDMIPIPTPIGPIPLPLVLSWVSFSHTFLETKVSVVNRVIYNSSHLAETRTKQNGKVIFDRKLEFENTTGRPVLTSSENTFGEDIFNLTIPASWYYDGMGSAYRRVGQFFEGTIEFVSDRVFKLRSNITPILAGGNITVGDEYLVWFESGGKTKGVHAVVRSASGGYYLLANRSISELEESPQEIRAKLLMFRSAQRNILDAKGFEMTALKNPLEHNISGSCDTVIQVPCESPIDFTDSIVMLLGAKSLVKITSDLLISRNKSGRRLVKRNGRRLIKQKVDVEIEDTGVVLKSHKRKLKIQFLDAKGRPLRTKSIRDVHLRNAKDLKSVPKLTKLPKSGRLIPVTFQFLTKGKKVSGYMATSAPIATPGLPLPELTIKWCRKKSQDAYTIVDKVIDASATTFVGDWIPYYVKKEHIALDAYNPNENGVISSAKTLGVWRPQATYKYFDQRKRSDPVNLKEDGVYVGAEYGGGIENGIVAFSESTSNPDSCVAELGSSWRPVSAITKYSPYGDPVEAKDIRDVHSVALFGHSDSVPIATATNATIGEIGYEGFEEHNRRKSPSPNLFNSGNFTFLPITENGSDSIKGDYYHLETADARMIGSFLQITKDRGSSSGRGAQLSTDAVYSGIASGTFKIRDFLPSNACTPFQSRRTVDRLASGLLGVNPDSQTIVLGNQPFVDYVGNEVFIGLGGPDDGPPRLDIKDPVPECFGQVVIEIPDDIELPPDTETRAWITEDKAHTGNVSLKVLRPVKYKQPQLVLKNKTQSNRDKQYIFGAWVSRDDTDTAAYTDISITIGFDDENNTRFNFKPSGPVIEGWQRVEGKFTPPSTESRQFWILLSNADKTNAQTQPAYFDDLRIHPSNASFNTFVYNRIDQKLRATLNESNFAMLFDYDEKGDLYLLRKETLQGIVSVEEGRSNIRPTPIIW